MSIAEELFKRLEAYGIDKIGYKKTPAEWRKDARDAIYKLLDKFDEMEQPSERLTEPLTTDKQLTERLIKGEITKQEFDVLKIVDGVKTVNDIVRELKPSMNFKTAKASISRTIGNLLEKGFVTYQKRGKEKIYSKM